MRIEVIFKDNNPEKEIILRNGRRKRFLYYRCKDLIICRNLSLKGNPAISVYPVIRNLIENLKKNKLKNKKLKVLSVNYF